MRLAVFPAPRPPSCSFSSCKCLIIRFLSNETYYLKYRSHFPWRLPPEQLSLLLQAVCLSPGLRPSCLWEGCLPLRSVLLGALLSQPAPSQRSQPMLMEHILQQWFKDRIMEALFVRVPLHLTQVTLPDGAGHGILR